MQPRVGSTRRIDGNGGGVLPLTDPRAGMAARPLHVFSMPSPEEVAEPLATPLQEPLTAVSASGLIADRREVSCAGIAVPRQRVTVSGLAIPDAKETSASAGLL